MRRAWRTLEPISEARAIAGSTLWQVASQVVMAGLSIVTTKFVAVGLSQELAGTYNTAYGYLQLFGILADFSLYAVAVREVSRAETEEEKERVLGTLLSLRCIILACSMGLALGSVWIMPTWRGSPLPLAVTIASFVPTFTLIAGIFRTAFQVHYRMHFVFVAEVLQRVLTVTLIGAIVAMGFRDTTDLRVLYAFLGIGGFGALLLCVLSFIFAERLIRIRFHWDRKTLAATFLQALPYGLAFLCTALYRQFDVTMIALLRPDYEKQNAYYGFVQRMMDVAYLLPTFVLNSTLPLLAARDKAGKDVRGFVGTIFTAILLLGSTTFLFAFVWARPLMALMTKDSYLSTATEPGSDTSLHLLAFSMLLNSIVLFSYYCLLNRHAWKPLLATLAFGGIFALTSNFFLIPPLGFIGASYTSVMTHALLAVILFTFSLRTMPMKVTWTQIGKWAAYTALLGSFLFVVRPFLDDPWKTVGGLALAAGVMVLIAHVIGIKGLMKVR